MFRQQLTFSSSDLSLEIPLQLSFPSGAVLDYTRHLSPPCFLLLSREKCVVRGWADIIIADRVAATQNQEPRQPLFCSPAFMCRGLGEPFPAMSVWSSFGSFLEGLHLLSAGELWCVCCGREYVLTCGSE